MVKREVAMGDGYVIKESAQKGILERVNRDVNSQTVLSSSHTLCFLIRGAHSELWL